MGFCSGGESGTRGMMGKDSAVDTTRVWCLMERLGGFSRLWL